MTTPNVSSSRSGVRTSSPLPERDDAARQQEHLVVLGGLADVVGRGDDRRAPVELAGERLEVAFAPAGIEAGGRLVEDDEVGATREGLGEVDALALPARERAQGRATEVGDAHRLHRPAHEVMVGRAHPTEQAEVGEAGHAHDVDDADRQHVRAGMELRDVRDPRRVDDRAPRRRPRSTRRPAGGAR